MARFPVSNDDSVFKRRHDAFRWGQEITRNSFGNGSGFQYDYENGNGSGRSYRELIQYWS